MHTQKYVEPRPRKLVKYDVSEVTGQVGHENTVTSSDPVLCLQVKTTHCASVSFSQ